MEPRNITKDSKTSFASRNINDAAYARHLHILFYIACLGYERISEPAAHNKEHLRWVHTLISNAKAVIQGTYHGLDEKYLHLYFAEFSWRFNRRGMNLFDRMMASVTSVQKIELGVLKG